MAKKKRIVVLGAGFSGVYAFKRLHKHFHGDKNVELIIVSDTNYFLFTPLLHEVATGNQTPTNIVQPIRKILGCCLAEFWMTKVTSIDFEKEVVETEEGDIAYDYLIVGLGAETNFFNTSGTPKYVFPLKTMNHAISIKNRMIESIEHATQIKDKKERKKLLSFTIVGGGPTGVELAAEMSDLFYKTFKRFYNNDSVISNIKITLIQKPDHLLKGFSPRFAKKAIKILKKHKIDVKLGHKVKKVSKDHVELSGGEKVQAGTVIWTSGVKATDVEVNGADKDRGGKLKVNKYLQLGNHKNVFCLGDFSLFIEEDGKVVPATAQAASKQAVCAADNICALLKKKKLKQFKYKHSGTLVSLGRYNALAEIGPFFFSGFLAWWIWRTIYLMKLISWRKRFRVAVDWTINLFAPRDISKL